MTIDQFYKIINGQTKGYPNDSSYLGECLSLVKLYIKLVCGIEPPSSGINAAYGYWTNFPNPLPSKFTKVAYKPGRKPLKGDIVIWGTKIGKSGHIAIAYMGLTTTNFTSFDQNWGGKQAHLVKHDYNGVLGWLTPKKGTEMKFIREKGKNTVYLYGTKDGKGIKFPISASAASIVIEKVTEYSDLSKYKTGITIGHKGSDCPECPPPAPCSEKAQVEAIKKVLGY